MVFNIFPDHKSSFEGIHRSGWSYAISAIESDESMKGHVTLDTYVDRTFHTMQLSTPYTTPWVGIVHHTFDTTHSQANNEELLRNEVFMESLKTCEGLYVFTKSQKKRWDHELKNRELEIPVEVIVHPTELVPKGFSLEKFRANEERSMIQIGAWLRDMYAIYKVPPKLMIETPTELLPIKKKILQGPKMESYVCPDNFMDWFERNVDQVWGYSRYGSSSNTEVGYLKDPSNQTLPKSGRSATGHPPRVKNDKGNKGYMCRDATKNKYVGDMIEYIKVLSGAVEKMNELSNDEYDEMLTKNLVMIRLVDASAVNTILECVVRRTPIIVNRLEAVEEILGEDYPMYYESIYDIPALMKMDRIEETHNYMKTHLDKDKHSDKEFLKSIRNSKIYKKLHKLK